MKQEVRKAIPPRQSTEHVYTLVRRSILDGEIPAGSDMAQVALADELGVSRTPLREALRMLQSERLVESEPNRRVRVASLTPEDLEELSVIRVTLEAQALRLSVPAMTPEDHARLEGYMAEMAHFADVEDYERWNIPHAAFHRLLTEPAGPRINELLGQCFDYAERYRRLHIGLGPGAWATAGHRQIIDACVAGDRDLAATVMASHLARTAFEVSDILDPSYEPAQLRATLTDVGAEVPKRLRKAS